MVWNIVSSGCLRWRFGWLQRSKLPTYIPLFQFPWLFQIKLRLFPNSRGYSWNNFQLVPNLNIIYKTIKYVGKMNQFCNIVLLQLLIFTFKQEAFLLSSLISEGKGKTEDKQIIWHQPKSKQNLEYRWQHCSTAPSTFQLAPKIKNLQTCLIISL